MTVIAVGAFKAVNLISVIQSGVKPVLMSSEGSHAVLSAVICRTLTTLGKIWVQM